jgi:hypothetical protein
MSDPMLNPHEPVHATSARVVPPEDSYNPADHLPAWVIAGSKIHKIGKTGTWSLVIGLLILLGALFNQITVSPLTGQSTDGSSGLNVKCGSAISVYSGNVDTQTGVFSGLTNGMYGTACQTAAKKAIDSGVPIALAFIVIGGLGLYLGRVATNLEQARLIAINHKAYADRSGPLTVPGTHRTVQEVKQRTQPRLSVNDLGLIIVTAVLAFIIIGLFVYVKMNSA